MDALVSLCWSPGVLFEYWRLLSQYFARRGVGGKVRRGHYLWTSTAGKDVPVKELQEDVTRDFSAAFSLFLCEPGDIQPVPLWLPEASNEVKRRGDEVVDQ